MKFNLTLLLMFALLQSGVIQAQSARTLFTINETMQFRAAPDEYQRYAIDLSSDLLANPPVTGEILQLPLDGDLLEFRVIRTTEYFPGIWSVSARDVFSQSRYVTITYSEDMVTGKILNLPENHIYHFGTEAAAETNYLARMRPEQLPVMVCEALPGDLAETAVYPIQELLQSAREKTAPISHVQAQVPNIPVQSFNTSVTDQQVTIDILMVYSPAAESWASTNAGSIHGAIAQAMNLSQLALDNSDTGIKLRLVGSHLTNYTGDLNANMETHLRRLTTNTNVFRTDRDTDLFDGYMDEVHTVRQNLGADIVAMFVQDNSSTLGIAWRTSNYAGTPNLTFSVNSIRSYNTFTVIHEIGHNMGAAHGRSQSSNAASASGGMFEYSTGWEFFAASPNPGSNPNRTTRNTVMQYSSNTSSSYPGFSNPEITSEGSLTGTVSGHANNARGLREIKHAMAGQLPTRVDPPVASVTEIPIDVDVPSGNAVTVQIPISNNGSSDLLWSAEVVPGVVSGNEVVARQLLNLAENEGVVTYQNDFEALAPGTYEAGGGLRTNTASHLFQVSSANPAGGSRHLRLGNQTGVSSGSFVSVTTPLTERGQIGSYTVAFDLSITYTPSSRFDIYLNSAQTGGISAGLVILNSGQVFYGTTNQSGNETFLHFASSPVLENSRYYSFEISVDSDSNTLTYKIDGEEFASVPMLTHKTLDWIRFGKEQTANTDYMDVDNITVTRNYSGYTWLDFSTPSGVIPIGGSGMVDVELNAIGIEMGETREGSIVIRTSDPSNPVVTLPVKITALDPTSIDNDDLTALPQEVTLKQNFPNPFNPATTISFALPQASSVQLRVFDITGRLVATLADGTIAAGEHQVQFDASSLTSGLYIYELRTESTRISRKMMLIK